MYTELLKMIKNSIHDPELLRETVNAMGLFYRAIAKKELEAQEYIEFRLEEENVQTGTD